MLEFKPRVRASAAFCLVFAVHAAALSSLVSLKPLLSAEQRIPAAMPGFGFSLALLLLLRGSGLAEELFRGLFVGLVT